MVASSPAGSASMLSAAAWRERSAPAAADEGVSGERGAVASSITSFGPQGNALPIKAAFAEHFAVFNQARDTFQDPLSAPTAARLGDRLDSSV